MADGPPTLIEDRHGPVAVLTLRRPEVKNALSAALRDQISDSLDRLAADDDVHAVVVTGHGSAFCSGFDLAEFDRAASDDAFAAELWSSSDRFHETVLRFPLPMVAAVNGPAVAGGFDLAVMCDLRVADPAAWFSHPEIAFGDVVYGPLADLVGGSVARDLCLTRRKLTAAEALDLNVVNRLAPPDGALALARQIADDIAASPREVLVRTKAKAVRHGSTARGGTLDL